MLSFAKKTMNVVVRQNSGGPWNEELWGEVDHWPSAKILAMIPLLGHFVGWLLGAVRFRGDLKLENRARRQQLLSLHAKRPRPRLGSLDCRPAIDHPTPPTIVTPLPAGATRK